MEAGQAEMTAIGDRLARQYPESNKGASVIVEPVRSGIVGSDLQTTTVFLLGVVGFVLLLCCANVANLLLARATARAREIAVRSALGAERGRIIRQLLTESIVLAAIGGTLGLALGAAILKAAPALIPPGLLPASVTPVFDMRVVLFRGRVAGGRRPVRPDSGVAGHGRIARECDGFREPFVDVARRPAAQAARVERGGRGGLVAVRRWPAGEDAVDARQRRSRLSRGGRVGDDARFQRARGKNTRYPTDEAMLGFYDAVARDVAALPDVRNVGFSSSLPYGASEFGRWMFEIVGDPAVDSGNRPTAEYTIADTGYFRTIDLPIVHGRGFNERDTLRSVPVCLVNEALVRRHFKGRNPIGARIWMKPTYDVPAQVREIVGVARQTSGQPDAAEELLQIYVPLAQHPGDNVYMVVQPSNGARKR